MFLHFSPTIYNFCLTHKKYVLIKKLFKIIFLLSQIDRKMCYLILI